VEVIAGTLKHDKLISDSTTHIMDTKQFCVSIISESFLEAANYTAIDAPIDVSEWKLSGLTQRKSQ
jgi:flavin reductase (DIM6/NTAB) family NADH-FMN oxidoreductase RutF